MNNTNSTNITVMPSKLSGTVKAIPSKSQAHRAMICAALCKEETVVLQRGGSQNSSKTAKDITATRDCLNAIRRNDGLPLTLNCGESGSTFRFLLPVAAALGLNASFALEGRLPERPLSPLYEELIRHGCIVSPQGSNPFTVSGQLTSGEYTLDGGVSSQFISGLLFALPLLDGDSEIRINGKLESAPYIDLTVAMLQRFGIKTEYNCNTFFIKGSQTYKSPGTVYVEGDWSNAAFWLCAGAVSALSALSESPVICTGLDLNSKQGDRAVLEILKQFGAAVKSDGNSVTVLRAENSNIIKTEQTEINAADIPDLVPILAVTAASFKGDTVIRNVKRLRIKESDRLTAVTALLNTLADCEIAVIRDTGDDCDLIIRGGIPLKGGVTVNSHNDHRIAMSAAIAACLCEEPITIEGADAVNKSYPWFFDDFKALGGITL